MIFLDPDNPNKYSSLKKLLVPHDLGMTKVKYGKGDGGYVLAEKFISSGGANLNSILSYGIGSDPEGVSFDEAMAKRGNKLHMYDASIESPPKDIDGDCSFFSEFLTEENFKDHVEKLKSKCDSWDAKFNIVKMDVEGCEYDWLSDSNLKLLKDNFCQLTLEVHCLIEERMPDWTYESVRLEVKPNRNKVEDFFKKLNNHFYLYHLHANNHSPRYVDLPDDMEMTFVNKDFCESKGIDNTIYPKNGLDEPNFGGRKDYVLDWWI